jgi:succinate-acetate transporter protein
MNGELNRLGLLAYVLSTCLLSLIAFPVYCLETCVLTAIFYQNAFQILDLMKKFPQFFMLSYFDFFG